MSHFHFYLILNIDSFKKDSGVKTLNVCLSAKRMPITIPQISSEFKQKFTVFKPQSYAFEDINILHSTTFGNSAGLIPS